MKYAEKINDVINAFKQGPLEGSELAGFYCDGTMEFRTGNKHSSPMRDICDACQIPSGQNAFLLLGHKGCGKSTELNKMSSELAEIGYHVITVQCAKDLDMNNPLHTDLLILMGEALLKITDEIKLDLHREIREQIITFWSAEIEKIRTATDSGALLAEVGVKAESPKFLSAILQVFSRVKADIKFSVENRTVYREKMSQRSREWLSMLELISDEITKKLDGRQPIVVFEDLDKINPEDAWKVFSDYAATLAGVTFPVIYTFPIALSYDPRFAALSGYYETVTLPMIKQKTIDGRDYQEGIDIIIEIIEKRVDLNLFDEKVLETLIVKTGGSLRDLFYTINNSVKIAIRRESDTVSTDDMKVALIGLKSLLTRRIERKHFDFLSDIYNGNRQKIENKEMLLEMLQANAVLEYNSDRWHDVHPLVADFLVEQELV